MIFIGVTGGIGSGKSTVCSLFEKKSVKIFYADVIAKEILSGDAFKEVVNLFGNQILDSTKKLDRKILAEIVFQDPNQLEKLNAVIHPRVFKAYKDWKNGDFGKNTFALVEAALMFESGMFEMVDYVLALVTNEEERIHRVSARDASTAQQVKARMKNQLSTEELLELSDFQIQNNGTITDLGIKVNFFYTLFSSLQSPKEL